MHCHLDHYKYLCFLWPFLYLHVITDWQPLKKLRNSERNSAIFLRTNYGIYISVEVNWGLGKNSMFRNLLIRYWHSKNKLIENWKQLPNSQWNYNIWWAKNSRWFFFSLSIQFHVAGFLKRWRGSRELKKINVFPQIHLYCLKIL